MTKTSTQAVWMLEDLEPWPDAPEVGDVFAATTFWVTGDLGTETLPDEVLSTVPAAVREHTTQTGTEWTADIGHGFTTMLPHNASTTAITSLRGCLMWDHYLWLDYRTTPTGNIRLLARPGHIVQREHLTATSHPNMFSVSYDGPLRYSQTGYVPDGFAIRWNVLSVEPVAGS